MKAAVAALLLCGGFPAFCQSAGPSPDKTAQTPPDVFLRQKELDKGPPVWQITPGGLQKMIVPPGAGSLRQRNAQMDPKMVVHPPQASIGVQPPGTQVAQNLYPGLQLMPIDQSKAKVEPIPITFSNMKVEKIPTTWTHFTVSPIQSGKAATTAK